MASDMLCYPDGTDRFSYDGTGSGSGFGAAVSAERFVRGRAGFGRLKGRPLAQRSAP